jgi:hypothetical protein
MMCRYDMMYMNVIMISDSELWRDVTSCCDVLMWRRDAIHFRKKECSVTTEIWPLAIQALDIVHKKTDSSSCIHNTSFSS